jgi:hypothetical protein
MRNKTWIIMQYNNEDLTVSYQLIPIDGRYGLYRWHDAAKQKRLSLAFLGKKVNGFRVIRGQSILRSVEIYKGILLPYSFD